MYMTLKLENGATLEVKGNEVNHIMVDGSKIKINGNFISLINDDMVLEAEGNQVTYTKNNCVLYNSVDTGMQKQNIGIPNHFFLIGENERKIVMNWRIMIKRDFKRYYRSKDKRIKFFLQILDAAIKEVDYDFCIATLEPSLDKDGKIYYKQMSPIATTGSPNSWAKKVTDFYKDESWYSDIAHIKEVFIFYAYRFATNKINFEEYCESTLFNEDNPESEASGIALFGGFEDGINNTVKLCKNTSNFILLGTKSTHYNKWYNIYYHFTYPIINRNPDTEYSYVSPIVVLRPTDVVVD